MKGKKENLRPLFHLSSKSLFEALTEIVQLFVGEVPDMTDSEHFAIEAALGSGNQYGILVLEATAKLSNVHAFGGKYRRDAISRSMRIDSKTQANDEVTNPLSHVVASNVDAARTKRIHHIQCGPQLVHQR